MQFIERAFKRAKEQGWNKIYILVDIHGTILEPSYSTDESYLWYPYAKETLKYLSKREDICLILWTSSHKATIEDYLKEFKKYGIYFDYINENPEIKNTELGCFDKKPYFNIGIDDKFGFNAEEDWYELLSEIKKFKIRTL